MKKSSYLKYLYNLYNEVFFDDRLPKDTVLYFVPDIDGVKSKAAQHRRTNAVTRWYADKPIHILIRRTPEKSMRYIMGDLLHEMCHVANPRAKCSSEGVYGGVFDREMKRLAAAGAFEFIW